MHSAESRSWKMPGRIVPLQGLQPSASQLTRESDRPQQASSEGVCVSVASLRGCVEGLSETRLGSACLPPLCCCYQLFHCTSRPKADERSIVRLLKPVRISFSRGHLAPMATISLAVWSKVPVAICDVTTGTVRPIPITDQWREGFNARPLISPMGSVLPITGWRSRKSRSSMFPHPPLSPSQSIPHSS